MESNSYPQAIHVSHSVYKSATDKSQLVRLPARFIKGKGVMTTYLVKVGDKATHLQTFNIVEIIGSKV